MTKQDQIPIEGKEKNKKEQIPLDDSEFWVIDDGVEIINSLMRMWNETIEKNHLKAKIFSTAFDALSEIANRKKDKKSLPKVIFMDAWLEDDVFDELRFGGNVIKKIREMDDILQPLIVAHSSEDRYNESLKASGADLMIKKGDYKASKAFLENLGQSNKTKNEKD